MPFKQMKNNFTPPENDGHHVTALLDQKKSIKNILQSMEEAQDYRHK